MSEPGEVLAVGERALDELIEALADLHIRKPFAAPSAQCAVVAEITKEMQRAHLNVVLGLAVARLADREVHS